MPLQQWENGRPFYHSQSVARFTIPNPPPVLPFPIRRPSALSAAQRQKILVR
ncbi:MAG: hypothetical protein FWG68_12505 [Defluviitaleaceae bacterium]|nr:hypothetical protein [Defluviitaleaceae bacterium]